MVNRAFPDRWVRFHSLPESKRYPDHDAEYDVVLHRHNSILDELFQGQDIRIITTHWSDDPEPQAMSPRRARQLPGARHWRSLLDDEDDTDPTTPTCTSTARPGSPVCWMTYSATWPTKLSPM